MNWPTVAIVDDEHLPPTAKLAAALDVAGFWHTLQQNSRDLPPDEFAIVLKPQFAAFQPESASATDPGLVEALIDLLHDRGFTQIAVVGSADSSALWANNRDIYALSDLLGYQFVTPKGRSYEVFDLSENPDTAVFPVGSVLHQTGISPAWLDADFRIVFAKNMTDEEAGYALCLDSLIGILPLLDKTLSYRRRRDPGEVVTDLINIAPVHFSLIDAITSAHGTGGRRAPEPVATGTVIGSKDIVLTDYIGALKMGLDPYVSPVFARVSQTHPLPLRYEVAGPLGAYAGWKNVPALLMRTTRGRAEAVALGRLVEPLLQLLDSEMFPLKNLFDAQLNTQVAAFFKDTSTSPTSYWLLILANILLGGVGHALEAYRTLFDKDSLRHRAVSLGIDPTAYPDTAFEQLADELIQLEPLAGTAPEASEGLRWRYVDEAVIFSYAKTLAIDFDLFVGRVDVARTIQFMNDYLGGVIVPVSYDDTGRPIRQFERNVYLPQPNYLVLYDGKPIDVTKLEIVEYQDNQHRLFWKTVRSENGSAAFDDGIATFARAEQGTSITIIGRQLFTLPVFWQVFDLNLIPDIKKALVTHAYRTFFDRTVANFEALVEGREIRIGRPVDEPSPLTAEQIMIFLERVGEIVTPIFQRWTSAANGPADGHDDRQLDADGFVHVRPSSSRAERGTAPAPGLPAWSEEINRFIAGLREAARQDLTREGG